MNNDITINPDDIRILPNHSVTDPETIRQIALWSIRHNDNSLNDKIRPGMEVCGLYPHVIERCDFPVDVSNNIREMMLCELYKHRHEHKVNTK